jgi:hypothetical protein
MLTENAMFVWESHPCWATLLFHISVTVNGNSRQNTHPSGFILIFIERRYAKNHCSVRCTWAHFFFQRYERRQWRHRTAWPVKCRHLEDNYRLHCYELRYKCRVWLQSQFSRLTAWLMLIDVRHSDVNNEKKHEAKEETAACSRLLDSMQTVTDFVNSRLLSADVHSSVAQQLSALYVNTTNYKSQADM